MINQLLSLSRTNKKLVMMLFDSIVLILILLVSFSIRLGYWFFPELDLVVAIFAAPIIAIPIFVYFGLYRAVIRYIDLKILIPILQAVSLYALIWGILGFMAALDGIPRSVILINWILSLLLISGFRASASWLLTRDDIFALYNSQHKRVLIYGAGDAGIQLISALMYSKEYHPVGFIDDSKELQGSQIRGLDIHSIDNIEYLINTLKVDEVLITMPSVSRNIRLSIINKLESYPVHIRVLPGVSELAEGKVNISDLREVNIKDLLGRDRIEPSKKLLCKNIYHKVVLVTGAGGSIGSELCRRIVSLEPKVLILYEMSELALYTIEKELSNSCLNSIDIYPVLGNINNRNRLSNIFKKFSVNTIYHAAAYKHVPIVEFNNSEGIENNIFGTLNCAQAAIDNSIETFVLISTDKAVRPTNTMGATKRTAELVLQSLAVKQENTKFSIVRFGNVLGSSGSVIPLFKQQIEEGGPITITHKDIIRYFMTISEAVDLVIQSGAMGKGGDLFLLDMGEPVSILDLAKKMIRLSGLEVKDKLNPDGDIEIKYIGLRPGEKLYEELLISKNASKTSNPKIMCAQEHMMPWDELNAILDEMKNAILTHDQIKLRSLLIQAVPEFQPQSEIIESLYKN